MTFDQIILICLLFAVFGAFAIDRLRIEVVAVVGLLSAFLIGLVPQDSVFDGFAHPAVITVAEILILVGALQASNVMSHFSGFVIRYLKSPRLLLIILCTAGGFVSVFMNNIGALALMLPLTTSIAERAAIPLNRLLMPLSFATLLGGTCSLIGTPANLIVSDELEAATGRGFALFDFAVIGVPAALAGLAAIILVMPRLLPKTAPAIAPSGDEADEDRLILEASLPPLSRFAGSYLPAAESELGGSIENVRRGDAFVFGRRESIRLEPGDTILINAPARTLSAAVRANDLVNSPSLSRSGEAQASAVVVPESVVLGSRISTLGGFEELGLRITAITSPRKRLEGRFSDLQLAVGDVLHMAGPRPAIEAAIREHGLLGVSSQTSAPVSRSGLPVVLGFFAAVALSAFELLRPELAFGASIAGLIVLGYIDLPAAIRGLNWPILLMLAAMIPIGQAVETTGTAALVAQTFLSAAPSAGPAFVFFAVLMTAVIITPFVNNASTAIVLAPIALEIAQNTGLSPEIVLLAVAVGVSLDFLTPFGHHNNTIIMGIGGYRFTDFPKAGLPVLAASLLAAFLALRLAAGV